MDTNTTSTTIDDPYKLTSSILDPTSQPLLSKTHPYHGGATTSQPDNQENDQSEILLISYNHGPRPFKDLPFLILFILFVLSTFAFGIFASVNKNPHHDQVSIFTYNPTTSSCTLQNSTFSTNPTSLNSSKSSLSKISTWTLVITLLLSVPFVLFILFLLKNYTKQIVYASIPFFILLPLFLNVYWFVACTVSSKCSYAFPLAYRIVLLIFVFLIIGIIVWIFVVNWHRVELTISIIKVSSNALSRNLRLFIVLPALTLALFVYYAPIIIFLVFARFNGAIVPKENEEGYYCTWKQDNWVPAYYTLAILTMLWSATIMVETQVYVISGTIAQWYFSKDDHAPKRGIRNSLRNAFGPSSGSICLSGSLISVVRVVRAIVDSARQEDGSGILNLILRCCVNALLSAIDFLNKFTIIFVAITGESYCTSAKTTYDLLKRNLLSAVFVDTVSTRILAGIIFVLSAIYAILVCVVLKTVVHLGVESYLVAATAWLLLVVVLGFLVHVLDNVIDTVYVCFAIDQDRGEVCKQEVHEVYVHLPISTTHRQVDVTTPPLDV